MTAVLRPGEQLASTVCSTRVVVIKAPTGVPIEIACGGVPMVPAAGAAPGASSGGAASTLVGKRYVDPADKVELLCTSSGSGELSVDGVALATKAAKALPASD